MFWILLLVVKISTLYVRLFQIFNLTIYAHIFRHFVDFIYANLPFTNDCQKSACHFTDAKIQYAFLHTMPFYTTAFLHYCLLTPLPIYTTAFLHYCQNTGEPFFWTYRFNSSQFQSQLRQERVTYLNREPYNALFERSSETGRISVIKGSRQVLVKVVLFQLRGRGHPQDDATPIFFKF